VTKRPGRAASGSRVARKILDEEAVREHLRLDEEAIATLKACCSMRPPRNAVAIVGAIKARLEYSQPKPKQEIGLTGDVSIRVVNPYAREG
jgi:hypothetical protein